MTQSLNLSLEELLQKRVDDLTKWLKENASFVSEQRHLDEGTVERAYWHYGYRIALQDIIAQIKGDRQ